MFFQQYPWDAESGKRLEEQLKRSQQQQWCYMHKQRNNVSEIRILCSISPIYTPMTFFRTSEYKRA